MDSDELLNEVVKIIEENLNVDSSLCFHRSSIKLNRSLQHFMKIKLEARLQSMYESVMTHALKSEATCPGSGIVFLELLCNKNPNSNFIKSIVKREDFRQLFESSHFEKVVEDMLMSLLDSCNYNTKLSIKKSHNQKRYIDVVDGYSFSLKSLINIPYIEFKNGKVVCIDGYVESVSEIHRVLEEASNNKIPCILVVRGMSDDVLHTIKVNNDRKTLSLYPFVCPFDPENVNTIVDIAVVTGGDVFSSLKGNLISSVDLEKIPNVEHATLIQNSIRIKNSTTKSRVRDHVAQLKEKLTSRSDIDKILSNRLRSLSSSCIDIYIPDDLNFHRLTSQFDEGIRMINAILNGNYKPLETSALIHKKFLDLHEKTSLFLFTEHHVD